MGNPKGVPRDFDALERRRLRAVILFCRGVRPSNAARMLGVHRQSTTRWYHTWQLRGPTGLHKSNTVGRRMKTDYSRLKTHLKKLVCLGVPGKRLTVPIITNSIRIHFGVSYHKTQIARLMRKAGYVYLIGEGWKNPAKKTQQRPTTPNGDAKEI